MIFKDYIFYKLWLFSSFVSHQSIYAYKKTTYYNCNYIEFITLIYSILYNIQSTRINLIAVPWMFIRYFQCFPTYFMKRNLHKNFSLTYQTLEKVSYFVHLKYLYQILRILWIIEMLNVPKAHKHPQSSYHKSWNYFNETKIT